MLSFELSSEELLAYQGPTPGRTISTSSGRRRLAELAATDPETEFADATDFPLPFARAEHLYFTGTGGYRVHAKVIRPREPEGPAVLMFHGYGGEQPKWVDLLPYAARGFTVAALDVREQVGVPDRVTAAEQLLAAQPPRGGPGRRAGQPALPARLPGHPAARRHHRRRWPRSTRPGSATTGWSQGGGLSLVAAALTPEIKYTASVFPFLTDYQRAWELNLDTGAVQRDHHLVQEARPPAPARAGGLHHSRVHRPAAPGLTGPGRGDAVRRPRGRDVPALDAVRRLQQAHVARRSSASTRTSATTTCPGAMDEIYQQIGEKL